MLPLSSFAIFLISISAPVAQCQTGSLWGTFKDSLVNGITVDQIKTTGVATTFDYIIVGAGPGGLVMAARLTENPNIRVAVVERGTLNDQGINEIALGNLATSTFVDPTNPALLSSIDYIDITTPIKANGYAEHYPQGKMLGGSSSRGFSAYSRSTKGAMQKLADQVGDQSYAWDQFLPYFQKSTTFTPPNITSRGANSSDIMFQAESFPPTGGPLQVSFAHFVSPLATWMKLSWEALKTKVSTGHTAGVLDGVQYMTLNINTPDQHRSAADSAFYESARNRTNLVVFALSQVMQINFDNNKTTTGVKVNDINNQSFTLTAAKEVHACAGVFRTPQLLMVSGIGDANLLNAHDIPVISDRPGVGQNLQDQSFVGITYQVNFNTTSQIFNSQFLDLVNNTLFPQGQGVLTDALDLAVFEKVTPEFNTTLTPTLRAGLAALPDDWPTFQYLPVNSDLLIFRAIESKPPENTTLSPNYGSLACSLSAPFSRGSVSIKSNTLLDPPVVDIGYLNDERDIELLVIAFKRGRQSWTTPDIQPALIGREYWPGYDVVPDNDDVAIRNHVIQNVMPIWEATATCAMGLANDTKAVVDSTGKVFGVNGLRVVDASALPFSPPGHPGSVVFALAEKIADLVKADFAAGR